MIELGKIQKLEVKRNTSVGAFLNTGKLERGEDVLLPKKEVPADTIPGDILEVFVYKDSRDRMISTMRRPRITLGEVGLLKVVDITKIGAFLDWGLDKDLFLPFKEQTQKLEKGRKYLIGLYIDKSQRLCGTMKVRDFLRSDSPYKENDWVKGTIYSINDEFGAFVAVDNRYEGLIPKRELVGLHVVGEEVKVRVTNVKEDGKLDLSLRDKAHVEIDRDMDRILNRARESGGILYLNDYSSPEEIRRELSMSKSAFKKAVGRLLKEEKIEFIEGGIRLKI
ncbi:MAG TPA: S1 RNA-binding domain-containing protein [Tepidimicrobium sp.]|nr:S1 RNA-binding domain-containing protein [Tepidimicrobium sp.]